MLDYSAKKIFAIIFAGIIVALVIIVLVTWLNGSNPEVIEQAKNVIHNYGYFGIFISTIIAGSIIPFGSPIIVATAAGLGLDIIFLALISATGYTLGVLTSYIPAWLIGESYVKKKIGENKFQKYVEMWNNYGYKLCIIFSIIPGFPVDLLAIICGFLRTKAKLFIPICWITLLIQFTVCGFIGRAIGFYILP